MGFEGDLSYAIALQEFENKAKLLGRLGKEIKPEEIALSKVWSFKLFG